MIGVYQQEKLDFFDSVEKAIKIYLNRRSGNAGVFKLPSDFYNPWRQQYNANDIIAYIAGGNTAKFYHKIALVSSDIYTRDMNFIFGLADPLKKTALVSTYRLTGEKIMERISKEVIHELGHLLGLGHCSNIKCVMHFSNTVDDTDIKSIDFCEECKRNVG